MNDVKDIAAAAKALADLAEHLKNLADKINYCDVLRTMLLDDAGHPSVRIDRITVDDTESGYSVTAAHLPLEQRERESLAGVIEMIATRLRHEAGKLTP